MVVAVAVGLVRTGIPTKSKVRIANGVEQVDGPRGAVGPQCEFVNLRRKGKWKKK